MGCDIHLHTEVKIDGVWHHYSEADVDRWYLLFGIMAGVRSMEEPIVDPKGLPSDMTKITELAYDYWKSDAHHCSWFDAGEIKELAEWFAKHNEYSHAFGEQFGYVFGYNWYNFGDIKEEYEDKTLPECVEDIRFVFWFDN